MVSIYFIHGNNSAGKTQWSLMDAGCLPDVSGFCSLKDDKTHVFGDLHYSIAHVFFPETPLTASELRNIKDSGRINLSFLERLSREKWMNIVFKNVPFERSRFISMLNRLSSLNVKRMYICSSMPPAKFYSLLEGGSVFDVDVGDFREMNVVFPPSLESLYVEYASSEPGVFLTDESGKTVKLDVASERRRLIKDKIDMLEKRSRSLFKIASSVEKRKMELTGRKNELSMATGERKKINNDITRNEKEREAIKDVICRWVYENVEPIEFSRNMNDEALLRNVPGHEEIVKNLVNIRTNSKKLFKDQDEKDEIVRRIENEILKDERYIERYQNVEDEYKDVLKQIEKLRGVTVEQ